MPTSASLGEEGKGSLADPPRIPITDPFWQPRIKGILRNIVSFTFIVILLLLLADMSYLAGSAYHERDRIHALKILVVDNDGSDIGEAVKGAYSALRADTFVSLEWPDSTQSYRSEPAAREAVCKTKYWGAVYINPGATDRLDSAVNGSDTPATPYDAANAITYVYNAVRWPAIASLISADLQTLVAASRSAYYHTPGGTKALQTLNSSNSAAVSAYVNPISATADIIQPTNQGGDGFFTTVNMLIPQLVAVFINIILNMSMMMENIFRDMRVRDVWTIRFVTGKIYAIFAGLAVAGYIWAFREDWDVSAGQFFETWLVYILFLDINWQVYDSLLGSYIPLAWISLFIITWILVNLASCDLPMELQAGWYRVGWAFPAHSTWLLLVQVWSGCANRDYQALPILFSWWVVGHAVTPISTRKRCVDARKPDALAALGAAGQPAGAPEVAAPKPASLSEPLESGEKGRMGHHTASGDPEATAPTGGSQSTVSGEATDPDSVTRHEDVSSVPRASGSTGRVGEAQ
ncbi:Nitrosoguanidine resistance protein SNG1 [Cytospora mali]|uniref:Nitrosoguanidine resistance protein SNG1 n=1 Tax=Cytospora mali TaxID=578113 RepID=A0A194W5M4_CYTMA|nr:Nitrosoguanidine resistance protein SNG1 [Valsa mali]